MWDSSPTCKAKAGTCEEYVAKNPKDFVDAFWLIHDIKVYEDNGKDSGGRAARRRR